MDNDATSSSRENNNGCVTKSGVIGRGEAVILDSVSQILDVLRTGHLDTNKEQLTNGQTNEPVTVAPNSVDEGDCVNKGFNDYGESSGVSKNQVQPSQQYDSDTTSISSEEDDEEDPVGNGMMLPREAVNMQSKLENCKNVQVGKKMEISGAMTVNTILNVITPPDEGRFGHDRPRDQPSIPAHHPTHRTDRKREGDYGNEFIPQNNSRCYQGRPGHDRPRDQPSIPAHHPTHRTDRKREGDYGNEFIPQNNSRCYQGDAVNSGSAIVYLEPQLPSVPEEGCCSAWLKRIFAGVFVIIFILVAIFVINKIRKVEERSSEFDQHFSSMQRALGLSVDDTSSQNPLDAKNGIWEHFRNLKLLAPNRIENEDNI